MQRTATASIKQGEHFKTMQWVSCVLHALMGIPQSCATQTYMKVAPSMFPLFEKYAPSSLISER